MDERGFIYEAPADSAWKKAVMWTPFFLYGVFYLFLLYMISKLYPQVNNRNQWCLLALAGIYALFLARYGSCVFQGIPQVTVRAAFDGRTLICWDSWVERRMCLKEVRFTVLCIGATFNALVLVSDRDYLVLNRCNGFGWLRDGEESGEQFHELVGLLQAECGRSEVVLCRRGRRQRVPVPRWVFEWDCRSSRAEKTVQMMREKEFLPESAGTNPENL